MSCRWVMAWRLDVDLEAVPVERGDERVERGLLAVRRAGVAAAVEVGREHCGGARLDDAVMEELHRDRPNVRRGEARAPVAKPGEHRVAVARRRQGGDDPHLEPPRAVGFGESPEFVLTGVG